MRFVELLPPLNAFFAKVERPESGCWEWAGATSRSGYGCIRIKRKLHVAHRLSYHWFVGPVTSDMVIRHKCDNPPCVNPAHLEAGTHADNVHDTITRGRKVQVRGERVATAKLTESDVIEIRELAAQGHLSRRAIARSYGMSHPAIDDIVARRRWKHVGAPS